MGAARPSGAGLKMEPSVSQPLAPSAAAMEQEAVSSPLHPTGVFLSLQYCPYILTCPCLLQALHVSVLKDEAMQLSTLWR